MTGEHQTDPLEEPAAEAKPPSVSIDDVDIEGRRAAHQRTQTGRKVIKFGVMAVGIMTAIAGLIYAVSSSPDHSQSSVTKASDINEPPGAPNIDPQLAKAYDVTNNRNRARAAMTGDSSVLLPIVNSQGDLVKPQEAPISPQPTQQPTGQQVHPQQVFTPYNGGPQGADPRRAAMLKAIQDTLNTGAIAHDLQHTTEKVEAINTFTQVGTGQNSAKQDKDASRSTEGTGMLIAEPHEAYAVTRIAADSDAIAPITLEILSGPLTGASVYGKPVVQQKNMQISVERMHFDGADCKVEAMVIDPVTKSPALDVDVANHWGERIGLPAIAGLFGAVGKAASQPTTSVNTSTGTSTITQVSPLSPSQIAMAGIGGAGNAAAAVVDKDAESIKPTVTLDANKPQMVAFLKGIYSGDCKR